MTGYDVIGDIHGYADPLVRLLEELGYRETGGAYRHPERQAVFVGDLIDRGPEQVRTLELVRAMVDARSAQVVLGNHEFNAVAWATPLVDGSPAGEHSDEGSFARAHDRKNRRQHRKFLEAIAEGSPEYDRWIAWFRSLPIWLDLGGLRVVHACWDPVSLEVLGDGRLTDEIVMARKGDPLYEAAEIVLKGPEVPLGDHSYADKDGNPRNDARLKWWEPEARTFASALDIPEDEHGTPVVELPDTPIDRTAHPTADLDVPVLYGHYWRPGRRRTPAIDSAKSACLDWSIAKDGKHPS